MVTATTIVLIDRLFYESLDLIRRHGKIEYHQSGKFFTLLNVPNTNKKFIKTCFRPLIIVFFFLHHAEKIE